MVTVYTALIASHPSLHLGRWAGPLTYLFVIPSYLWISRRNSRRAGPVLLSLYRPYSVGTLRFLRWLMRAGALGILYDPFRALVAGRQLTYRDLSATVMGIGAFAFAQVMLDTRAEVRREGLLVGGSLTQWSRIISWNWIDQRQRSILVLHLHRRIQFLPPGRIWIRPSQKDQVEAILTQQLGEWRAGD
jgi:hypothetical protein